jgi:hypothetical protein
MKLDIENNRVLKIVAYLILAAGILLLMRGVSILAIVLILLGFLLVRKSIKQVR